MATTSAAADDISPAMDYASHWRQFHRFVHLVKWFGVHVALMLPALYAFIIAQSAVAGSVLLILAVGALGYGIVSTPEVARDVSRALDHRGEAT